jgi:uncharacterized phage-associated protein
MTYSAIVIANYFINLSKRDKKKLTPLKLIKLVYISHGWCLALFNRFLIKERVIAWKYGPVIEPLYREFKKYGNNQITRNVKIQSEELAEENNQFMCDTEAKMLLDKVWEKYGDFSGIELSSMTHKEGSPWYDVWEKDHKNSGDYPIDDRLIKNYYTKLAEAN